MFAQVLCGKSPFHWTILTTGDSDFNRQFWRRPQRNCGTVGDVRLGTDEVTSIVIRRPSNQMMRLHDRIDRRAPRPNGSGCGRRCTNGRATCCVLPDDDVVYRRDDRIAGFDAEAEENWHEGCAEGLEGFHRFPDVKDLDVAVPGHSDMMGPSRGSSCAGSFELLDRRVVLLGREFAVGKVDSEC